MTICQQRGLGKVNYNWGGAFKQWYRTNTKKKLGLASWDNPDFIDELSKLVVIASKADKKQ